MLCLSVLHQGVFSFRSCLLDAVIAWKEGINCIIDCVSKLEQSKQTGIG